MAISKEELQFRSQFWGQKILHYDKEDSYIIDEYNILCSPMYVATKKISWITIDEVKIIARQLDLIFDKPGYLTMDSFKDAITTLEYRCFFSFADLLPVYQILQAWGYLLPFRYFDKNNQLITLQPNEIVKKGWAKTHHPIDKDLAF